MKALTVFPSSANDVLQIFQRRLLQNFEDPGGVNLRVYIVDNY